jgi:hypothetical protein
MESLAAGECDIFHGQVFVIAKREQPQGVLSCQFEVRNRKWRPVDIKDDIRRKEDVVGEGCPLAPPEVLGYQPAARGIINIGGPVPDQPLLKHFIRPDPVLQLEKRAPGKQDTEMAVGEIGYSRQVREMVLVK